MREKTISDDLDVTALVVAYHGDRWLPACLASLKGASRRPLHLLLVDNSGNTALDTLGLGAFEAERHATWRPMGFAEANNTALVQARKLKDVVLFLNQDTLSPPGWIDACLACLVADPALGAVSPLIRTYEDEGWDPSFVACLPPGTDPDDLYHSEATGAVLPVPVLPAPALLVRTDVLRTVGPFDPVFGSYYEDYDLCRRIRRAGWRVGFCRAATLRHFSGSATTSDAQNRKRMRQLIRNRLLYRAREAGRRRRALLVKHLLFALPRNLMRGLLKTPSSQPVTVTLGAHLDLMRLAPRLLSTSRDSAAWKRDLVAMNWAQVGGAPAESGGERP